MSGAWQWLIHWTGGDNLSGPVYGEWSGFIGDLPLFGLLIMPIVTYRRHNCHVHGCWRIGRHPIGNFIVCSRHHPDVPDHITAEHIASEHKKGTAE